MKEKKYAAEKIENFQVEVPMEEYVKECVDVARNVQTMGNYGVVHHIHLMWRRIIGISIVKFKLWDENYICQKNLQVSPMWKMNNGK